MSRIHHCPGCRAALRVPEAKVGKVVACPACGTKSRASAIAGDGADTDGAANAGSAPLRQVAAPPRRGRAGMAKPATGRATLRPFLQRWLTACGGVLAVAALLGAAGLVWEPPAMAASLICCAAIVCCTLAGTVWMAVDFGRGNVPLGLAVLLMPPIGIGLAFRDRGPARRGAVVYASSLAPAALLGLMLLAFLPRYTGAGQRAAQADGWEDLILQLDGRLRPDTPTVSVTYSVASRPGEMNGLGQEGERLLSRFKCYVPGSFAVDAGAGTIAYQYRGPEQFEALFAFYLSSATGAFFPQHRVGADGAPAIPEGQPAPLAPAESPGFG